jgi:hypothetical protein
MKATSMKRLILLLMALCLCMVPAAAGAEGATLSVLENGEFHTAATFAPGEFLSIGSSRISPGAAFKVILTGPNSYSVTIETTANSDGNVMICLPPYFNQETGEYTGANMTATVEGVGSVPFSLSGLPEVPGSAQDCLMGMLAAAMADINQAISIAQGMNGTANSQGIIDQLNFRRNVLAGQLQQLQDSGTMTWGRFSMSQTSLDLAARLIYADNLGLRKVLGMSPSLAAADYQVAQNRDEFANWFIDTAQRVRSVRGGMQALINKAEAMKGTAEMADAGMNFLSQKFGVDLRGDADPLAAEVQKYLNFAQPLFDWINKQFTQSLVNAGMSSMGVKEDLDEMQQRLNGLNSVISGLQLGVLLMEDENAQQMIQDFGVTDLLNNMSNLRQELQNWHDQAANNNGGGDDGGGSNVIGTWSVHKEFMWKNSAGRVDQWWFDCTMTLNDNGSVGGNCEIDTYALDGNNIFMIKTYSADNINRYYGTVSGGSMSGTWEGYWSCTGPQKTLDCWDMKWSASKMN